MKNKKTAVRLKRHHSIRLRVFGTVDQPRLAVYRGLRNITAQVIDDSKNKTLFSLTTSDKEIKQKRHNEESQ